MTLATKVAALIRATPQRRKSIASGIALLITHLEPLSPQTELHFILTVLRLQLLQGAMITTLVSAVSRLRGLS